MNSDYSIVPCHHLRQSLPGKRTFLRSFKISKLSEPNKSQNFKKEITTSWLLLVSPFWAIGRHWNFKILFLKNIWSTFRQPSFMRPFMSSKNIRSSKYLAKVPACPANVHKIFCTHIFIRYSANIFQSTFTTE